MSDRDEQKIRRDIINAARVPLSPPASLSSAPQVTDEAVDRALTTWFSIEGKENAMRSDMRRVLEQFAAAAPSAPVDGRIHELEEGLRETGAMISKHLEEYHDYETPLGQRSERTELVAIDHHIQGTLMGANFDPNAPLPVPVEDAVRGSDV